MQGLGRELQPEEAGGGRLDHGCAPVLQCEEMLIKREAR